MQRPGRANLILGLVVIVFAGLLLAAWIPLDTDSGLIEKARRRLVIGDAMAPSLAAVFLLLGGLGLVLFERRSPDQTGLSAGNLRHIASFAALVAVSLVLMRWTGPLAAALLQGDAPVPYRLLRDTSPWKYLGFALGGTVMIAGLIALVEGRLRAATILVAILAVVALIAVYDLPFEDLLLPPNGDV